MCSVCGAIHFHGINITRGTGRNLSELFLPGPQKYSGIAFRDYDLRNAEHRGAMWVGRVELLFSVTFKNSEGSLIEYDLALLSCLYDFDHPTAMGPLQRKSGVRMFYVPSIPWTIVYPSTIFLGGCRLCRYTWRDQFIQPFRTCLPK